MRYFSLRHALIGALLVSLAGCGLRFDTRAPWRDELEAKCLSSGAVKMSPYIEPGQQVSGSGACGMQQPLKVSALAGGTVGLTSRATLSCPAVSSVDRWVTEVVQPAAQLYYHDRVEAMSVGSYSCRNQDSKMFANISEHAFGNAVDIMAFRFASGRKMAVVEGWKGDARDQAFLREIAVDACDYFTTVLAPGSDVFHYNHIHLDLARHDAGYHRHICQPHLQFARRIQPRATASQIAGLNYTPQTAASVEVASVNTPTGIDVSVPVPPARPIDPKTLAALPPEPEVDENGSFKGVY